MTKSVFQADVPAVCQYLLSLIEKQAEQKALDWLKQKIQAIEQEKSEKSFFLAFVATPRFLSKEILQLNEKEIQQADKLRQGFYPVLWTQDQTARTILLLTLPYQNEENYQRNLNQLFSTGDMNELVALYAAFPLLPYPESHSKRAAEGIRTNMSVVFEAIALNNPYPADYLDENAWNQLFLKAVFTGRKIYQIQGIEKRANTNLARICSDYAHERWAAGRVVTPELWRPVGKFLDDKLFEDIQRVMAEENPIQHEAAALVCSQSPHPKAQELLAEQADLKEKIESGMINWQAIGEKWSNL